MNGSVKQVRVNSRYRSNILDSNTNFRYDLGASQVSEAITSIALTHFSCTRLFPNIYEPINRLNFKNNTTQEVEYIEIPVGQYSASEIVDAINHEARVIAQRTSSPVKFEVKLVDDKLQFMRPASWGVTPEFTILEEGLGMFIGIAQTGQKLPANDTFYTSGHPDLAGPNQIYVQSQTIASSNCIDSVRLGGWIPLIQAIPTHTIPYGYGICWQNNDAQSGVVRWSSPISIRSIDIQLTDKFGNDLYLPSNCHADLIFSVSY